MCNVYNAIGSLTTIKTKLAQNHIDDFKSIGDLNSFRESYETLRQQMIDKHELMITEERNSLSAEVRALENEIAEEKLAFEQKTKLELSRLQQKLDAILAMEKSYLGEIIYSLVALFLMLKIKYKEFFDNPKTPFTITWKIETLVSKNNRLHYISTNFQKAVHDSGAFALHNLEKKRSVIEELNPFIYGAIGEQKVVNELEKLSDEYTLINDFCFSFTQPIFYTEQRQYIKTIQIDHLLISRAGIFLIETKNWSKHSIDNRSLRSPIDQIKRTNFALSKILSSRSSIHLAKHHWGERKIPIRNLIVLINHKPQEEFEYVKVLTLSELVGYVEYFKPNLSGEETKKIADDLVGAGSFNGFPS